MIRGCALRYNLRKESRSKVHCLSYSQHTKGFEFKEADLIVDSLFEVTEEVLKRF
ncbi:MAG: hypothetical protein QME07_01265 [bacterium]|nr:hypothetical protein [bacterium]